MICSMEEITQEDTVSCFFCEKIISLEEVNYAYFRYKGTEEILKEVCCDDCVLENVDAAMGGGLA